MKKLIIFCIFLLCLLLTFSFSSYCSDVKADITSAIDDDLNNFMSSLPSDIASLFPKDPLNGDSIVNEKSIFNYIISYIFSGIDDIAKSLVSMFVLIIITCLLSSISNSLSNTTLSNAFKFCSTLCFSISIFQICLGLAELATVYIKTLCRVMNAFLPLMSTMGIMTGAISSTAISCSTSVIAISLTEGFLVVCLLPLVKACLTISIVKPISGCNLSGISKTIKTTFTSVIVFVMSILFFILSAKNVLAQGNDSITIKTARFAISSFVPIVGASINDSLKTVASSLSIIKNTCGIIAIIAISLLMVPIIIHILLYKLSFGLLGAICKALGCITEGEMLEEADSICGFMLVLIACTCVLFIFSLTIFINITVGVT